MRFFGTAFSLFAMASSVLAVAPAAASQLGTIGVTTAATVISTGTPPKSPERILEVGTDIFANELVKTSPSGRTQLMFGDGSSLLVGPNSNVTLDKYVYNPDKKTGQIILAATEGAFRYIGGFISKKTPVEIRTPTATIGIRGGINEVTVDSSTGRVTTTFIYGIATTITTPNRGGGAQTTTFARQDFRASILPGRPVSFSRMTSEDFNRINSLFARPPSVALVGLPAAGGVGAGPISVPPVGKLVPHSISAAGTINAVISSIPHIAAIPAVRSFMPPPVVAPRPQMPSLSNLYDPEPDYDGDE